MDVRMPDGTIIRGVPEGMTQTELQGHLDASRRPPAPKAKPEPDSVLSRIGSGLADPIVGAGQIMDRVLVNPIRQAISPGASSMEDVVRQRDAEYKAPEGMDWARMGGNVANPLSWAGGGAGKLPQAMKTLLPRALAASAAKAGAVQGALGPTAADDDALTFAAKKAGGAALGAVAGRVLGGSVTPDAAALMRQGVRVPPGLAAGGIEANIEQKLSSLPFAGSVIDKARREALGDVQGKVIERATGIPGMRSVEGANRAVSDLYEKAVPHLQPNPEGLYGAAGALNKAMLNPELTPQHQKILQGLFDDRFAGYAGLDGHGLKRLDSELGHIARKYTGHAASPSDQVLGDSIYEVLGGLRNGLEVGLSPDVGATLSQANRGYRQMIPVNKAASTRADELATPRALQKAQARAQRTDVTRMPPDPLLDPAVRVLTPTVPDSGTAGRAAAMSIPGVLAGATAYLPTRLANTAAGRKVLTSGLGGPRLSNAQIAALRAALAEEE